MDDFDVVETLRELEAEMVEAAQKLEFEKAALLRDQIKELKRTYGLTDETAPRSSREGVRYDRKSSQPRKRAARRA